MGTKFLLDTNVVIDYMGKRFSTSAKVFVSQIIDIEINISVINKIELLGFQTVDQELLDFVSYSNIYSLDENVISKTIDIRRQYRIKLPDAIIAATAIVHQLTLVTRNAKDFERIEGLEVVNPYQL